MQKTVLTFVIVILAIVTFAQSETLKPDSRLIDHFGKSKTEFWKNTDSLGYYNFIASYAFEVYSQEYIDAVKPDGILDVNLSTSEINALQNNLSTFNIFSSSIPWKVSEDSWYKIQGTNLYILIHNEEFLNKKFNFRK